MTKKPIPLTLRDIDWPEQLADVRCAPSGKRGYWRAVLDLRGMHGCGDIGLTDAKRLRDWLDRYIRFAQERGRS